MVNSTDGSGNFVSSLKKIYSYIPAHILFFIGVYLLGITLFTIPRLILIIFNTKQLDIIPLGVMFEAMFMGLRFDTVICGYIIGIPLVIYTLATLFNLRFKIFSYICLPILIILFIFSFFVSYSDIPYYNQFNTRITYQSLFLDTAEVAFRTVVEDPRYYIFIFLFLVTSIVFLYFLFKLYKMIIIKNWINNKISGFRKYIIVFLFSMFAIALTFLGIRGRLSTSPIRWGTAFFCEHTFANQLGLNPVFTFFQSYLDLKDPDNERFDLIDDKLALQNVKNYLNTKDDSLYAYPLAKKVISTGKPLNCNVILIIMESMSVTKMGIFGNPYNLTPNLDSIARRSYLFRNFFSDNIHTANGIYATMFGFPTLRNRHPFKNTVSIQKFGGLPLTLNMNGYQTVFFVTQDEQWSNIGGFLSYNGFQKIVSQKDYPKDKVLGLWGVPDHIMLEYAAPYLKNLAKDPKPFFASIVTSSDHGPYKVPKDIDFQPNAPKVDQQIVQYADWAIGRFMNSISKETWFENTIFVFVADHGFNTEPSYDISLPYHHIPFFIYSPKYFQPKEFYQISGQIDIFPTLLGLMNISYVNNSFGIDLFRENRPYAFFCSAEKIGCINEEFFWILRYEGKQTLHKYLNKDLTDYSEKYPEQVKDMATYATSMFQASQWMILNRKVKYIPFQK